MLKKKAKKSRQEINDASWELKRKRKHKGLPSGSRFNNDENSKSQSTVKQPIDPRVGSKKPISLIATESTSQKVTTKLNKSVTEPKQKLSPEQELAQLESDPLLDSLLDIVEQEGDLTKEQQIYLDSKLDRIDTLMKQLGYLDEDDEDEVEEKEDIVSLLKRK